jgi:hypothetical protein
MCLIKGARSKTWARFFIGEILSLFNFQKDIFENDDTKFNE